jgi:hypothetical protein
MLKLLYKRLDRVAVQHQKRRVLFIIERYLMEKRARGEVLCELINHLSIHFLPLHPYPSQFEPFSKNILFAKYIDFMPKMYHGGKRSRRNRRGSGIFCNDEKGPSYFENVKKSVSSLFSGQSTQPTIQMQQPQIQSTQMQPTAMNQNYVGGKRYKKRSMRKGGGPALPYNPAMVWSNESPYPQAVGGTRRKRRGGSSPVPYGPEVWSNIGPFPQAVGGKKKRRTRRHRH